MDKYAGGDGLHLYLLSGSMTNAPAASWEDHRVTRNNKQSAMSQILSLERSTSLLVFSLSPPFSPNLSLQYKHMKHDHMCRQTRIWTLFFFMPLRLFHSQKQACSHVTSSRWLDNLHQFELSQQKRRRREKKKALITAISLLTLLARIQWVFFTASARESHCFCEEMEIRETQ